MLVGSVFVQDGALHNGVALLDQGKVAAIRFKHELPNYGTFDEMRLFQPGPLPEPIIFRGTMIGRADLRGYLASGRVSAPGRFRRRNLHLRQRQPYEIDKDTLRIDGVAKRRAVDTGLPLAYLNRVGGQDELVFDGASFVVNGDGGLAVQMRDWVRGSGRLRAGPRPPRAGAAIAASDRGTRRAPEDIYCAMVLALRDYVNRNRFPGVVLGLSGGIDSAICAAIAADALGPDRVWRGDAAEPLSPARIASTMPSNARG